MPVKDRFTVEPAVSPEDKEEALRIRFEVFVKEQGVSPDVEADEYDEIDPHWLVRDHHGEAIATARLTDKGQGTGKVERVAVMAEYRSQGIGKLLLQQIENYAHQNKFARLVIHSQTQCQGFYEKLGYRMPDPTVFNEDGIPHVRMEKLL